jgi:hypothetical protein
MDGLYRVEKRQIPCPCRELNPNFSAVQPVATAITTKLLKLLNPVNRTIERVVETSQSLTASKRSRDGTKGEIYTPGKGKNMMRVISSIIYAFMLSILFFLIRVVGYD